MTYQEATDYLDSFVNYEKVLPRNYKKAFRLERTKRLLSLLSDPHKDLKAIHITGTKGKGSTAALIASMLKEAGFRVGLYTSPHLVSFRERIRINDEMIDEGSLCRIVSEIRSHLEKMRKEGLSFFEAYTAVAFLYFKEKKIDIAVLEVGLGGRLDATNVVEDSLSVITPISLEHTRILGSTVGKIAREKAQIIRENSACISSAQDREALDVISHVCAERRSRLYLVDRNIHIDKGRFDRNGQRFDVWALYSEYPSLELKLMGEHQIINAATAIGAVEALRMYGLFVPSEAVRTGIRKAEWPGRMEVINEDPLVVVDGAQNVASSKALIDALERHFNFQNLVLVLGISRDKDIEGITKRLSEEASFVILTRADNPRAANPKILRRYIKNRPTEVFFDSRDAMQSAYAKAGKDDIIVVTGSLFLVGEVREEIKNLKRKT